MATLQHLPGVSQIDQVRCPLAHAAVRTRAKPSQTRNYPLSCCTPALWARLPLPSSPDASPRTNTTIDDCGSSSVSLSSPRTPVFPFTGGTTGPLQLLHATIFPLSIFSVCRGDYKKVSHLWELEGAKERLQLVNADLMKMGSFDNAVMGCEGVFHIASPVVITGSDPKVEILDPAVNGTLNVLQSCKKNPTLKRVVLTSSSSALRIREDIDPTIPLNESSWSSEELCHKYKLWYALAKILAEKTAWKFAEENNLDLLTVVPSFVVGPCLPHDLSLTVLDVLGLLRGNTERFSQYGRMGYVHIDDVARSHILVYENASAHGRYLCSSDVLENHELAALISTLYPSLPIPTRFDIYHEVKPYVFNTSKLQKFGVQFKGIEEMFDDCIQFLKKRGFINV